MCKSRHFSQAFFRQTFQREGKKEMWISGVEVTQYTQFEFLQFNMIMILYESVYKICILFVQAS